MAKPVTRKIAAWIGTPTFVIATFASVFLAIILYAVNERLTKVTKLPGPHNQISERSKQEIVTLFGENENVIGGWVLKRNWEKTENPIFFAWARVPEVQQFLSDFDALQKSGQGTASVEGRGLLSNSQEALRGQIKCLPLTASNTRFYTPGLATVARTICIATLPPFQIDDKVNLGIMVVTDVSMTDPRLEQVKQLLLQLQVDIHNRDYIGHETWITPTEVPAEAAR